MLRAVGFTNVRELGHGQSAEFSNHLEVEAVPFFGEGQDRLRFAGNCYLVSKDTRNVLVHADSSPDSAGRSVVSSGILAELVARRGKIQVVFGTWWQERKFLFELSPMTIFLPWIKDADWFQVNEACDCSTEFVSDLLKTAEAELFVTYAESGSECFLPRRLMSSYVPTTSLMWKPLAEFRDTISRDVGVDLIEAQPHLQVVISRSGKAYCNWARVGQSRMEATAGE